MRITSNTFTSLVINSSQSAQQQLAQLQQQISSGETVEFASDNPLIYNQASQAQVSLAQLNSYNSSINTATSLTSANNTAMTSIHQIVANASELATSVTTGMSASSLAAVGTQVDSLISQLTSTVNQQYDGNYLFGGTANQPPISSGAYNANTNGQTTSINVQAGNSVQTGIVAGRPGSPGVDGFLYDSSSGTDVLASLQQLSADLKAGNASAVQSTDLPAVNKALDHVSLYVGSTAANMAAVSSASAQNQQLITSQNNQLNALTQTNLPNASVQLQQIQQQYEASLSAGSRLLQLSILNYLPST